MTQKGLSLESVGVNNYAFSKQHALDLLDLLSANGAGVFGGDVYLVENGKPELTYDNWCTDPEPEEDDKFFCSRSILESKEYVKKYPNPDAYFTITIHDL